MSRLSSLVRPILGSLLAGLLLRLLLMPFATHGDLLDIYWRASRILYHSDPMISVETVLRYLHAAYLWLIAPLLPPPDRVWIYGDGVQLLDFSRKMADWFTFISQPQVYRTLFLFKLPYLPFDLACAFLLYRLGANRQESRFLFRFWWLNPIVLFVTYVFGRHEVIALFFVLLSIYWIQRGRENLGMVTLGMSIAIRYYALLLLPFYLLSLQGGWQKRLKQAAIGLGPWLLVNLVTCALVGSPEVTTLLNLPHDNYLLAMRIQIAAWDNLYIFPLFYFLLLLHRLYNQEAGLQSLQQYSLIALFMLFATSYTGQSPQYWTWMLPFLALAAAKDRRLVPLHVAQIGCLIVYSFIGSRTTAGYLFAPIAPEFFWSLPSPEQVIGRFASPEVVISLGRTAFTAITLWMTYLVLRAMRVSLARRGS
jgi:hypothetical protein